jgi:DNA-directed RNA polymerase specialized sigma24 family protein
VLAWRDIAALRDPDRFEVWLRRLLVNACYREARNEKERLRMEVHVDPIEPFDPAVPDASRDVADRDQIERGFRRLQPEQLDADHAGVALLIIDANGGPPVSIPVTGGTPSWQRLAS